MHEENHKQERYHRVTLKNMQTNVPAVVTVNVVGESTAINVNEVRWVVLQSISVLLTTIVVSPSDAHSELVSFQ